MDDSNNIKEKEVKKSNLSYVNVNRSLKGYKDKYRRDVEKAMIEFSNENGKNIDDFTSSDWKKFFETNLLPLDKESERKMIDLFKEDRVKLNRLLVLHNTKAAENIAEVYFKRYSKTSPTQWYDLDDFKQMANEGLAIAAQKFNLDTGNKFITYATWWMLNRVRKPHQEKGATIFHDSLDAKITENDQTTKSGNKVDILKPEDLAPDYNSSNFCSSSSSPIDMIEKSNINSNMEFISAIKNTKEFPCKNIDKNRLSKMVEYLTSIVDDEKNTYNYRQIYLFLFKKIFISCSSSTSTEKDNNRKNLSSYINEAAKSKSELLRRINMSEKQYEKTCKILTRGNFNGI